jgi:hypothetical protein
MRAMNRLLAAAALTAFLVAILVIVVASKTGGSGSSSTTTTSRQNLTTTTLPTTTSAAPRKPAAVKLSAVGAYDPLGDKHENDDLAPLAVDGNPATFWKTEHYRNGFSKKGVGLLLDAGRSRAFSTVRVGTDGAGSSALIELGDNPVGPFRPASAARRLSGTTSFTLKKGSAGRYVLVWITSVPAALGETHITEVTARAVGPS